jgi:hypothetical protein
LAEQSGLDAGAILVFVRGDAVVLARAREMFPGLRFTGEIAEIERFAAGGNVAAVHDGFEQDEEFFDRVRAPSVALDWSGEGVPRAGAAINLFDHSGAARERCEAAGARYFEGLEYAIIGSRFHPFRDPARRVRERVGRICVLMGGADPTGITPAVAGWFAGWAGEAVEVDFVIGPLNPHAGRVEAEAATAGRSARMSVHRQPRDLPGLMAAADLAVSGCGTSLFEFGFLGVPAVVVPQNGMEERFGGFLASRGLAAFSDPGEIGRGIGGMLGAERREAFAGEGMRVFDGEGPARILRVLSGLAGDAR